MAEMLAGITVPDILGVIGSLLIVAGYVGISTGRMDGTRPGFQALNLAGSVLLIVSLWSRPNAGAMLIEILWAAVALVMLVRFFWARLRRYF